MNVDIITMGCSKNLVDSEFLINLFAKNGFKTYHNPDRTHGDIAIINTCGFIASAKEESINYILKLCDLKEQGFLKKVIVMGCLSERYMEELSEEIPQVDKFYGKFNWKEIIKDLSISYHSVVSRNRIITTPNHYAYVKIAEGCDRKCSYCAIPLITGKHKSRSIEDIEKEVISLVKIGVKEFQIIEQELTYYGIDLYHRAAISELVDRLAHIEGVEWLRLHYAYPNQFPLNLLKVIKENNNVCNYLDIALQHISDNILSKMKRNVTKSETLELLKIIRHEVPDISLRTTLLLGFPGETEDDFEELLDFVKKEKFDRLGAFTYSEEEGTYAAEYYENNVSEQVKEERLAKLMEVQEKISLEKNLMKKGKILRTIIDRCEKDFFVGRTEYDSPEIDGEVLIAKSENLEIGSFYPVLIKDSNEFDLYGTTKFLC